MISGLIKCSGCGCYTKPGTCPDCGADVSTGGAEFKIVKVYDRALTNEEMIELTKPGDQGEPHE